MLSMYKESGRCRRCLFQFRHRLIIRFSSVDLIFHAVAFSFDNDGFGVMKEPIKDGRSEYAVIVEDFRPVFEGFIGGNNQGALLIAKADNLEQEVCSCFVNRQESYLVNLCGVPHKLTR